MKVVRVVVCEIPTIFPQTWQFAVEGIWCGIIRDGRSYLGRPYHTDVTLRPRIRKYFKIWKLLLCCAFFSVQNRRPCLNRKLSSHRVWLLGGLRMQDFTYHFYNRRTFALVSLHRSSNDACYITKPFGWKSKAWWSHSVNRVWKCMPFCLKTWIKIGPK